VAGTSRLSYKSILTSVREERGVILRLDLGGEKDSAHVSLLIKNKVLEVTNHAMTGWGSGENRTGGSKITWAKKYNLYLRSGKGILILLGREWEGRKGGLPKLLF